MRWRSGRYRGRTFTSFHRKINESNLRVALYAETEVTLSKYDPVRSYLIGLRTDEWRASFNEIERMLGFRLPKSARTYPAWWANAKRPHAQQRAWVTAGWRTAELDLTAERIIFRREKPSRRNAVATGLIMRGAEETSRGELCREATLSPRTGEARQAAPRQELEGEVQCRMRFAWRPIGAVTLDAGGRLIFPKPPRRPGVYRFLLERAERRSVYIGETDDLERRFQHYRTPGRTQRTNQYLNALMRRTLAEGDAVSVAIIVDTAWLRMDSEERRADFSVKAKRVLVEQAALVSTNARGAELLNK